MFDLISKALSAALQMSYTYILLVATIIFLFSYWWLRRHQIYKHGNLPPGPRGLPLIGSILDLATQDAPYRTLRDMAGKYGDVFSLKLGQQLVIVLNSYDTIHEALVKNAPDFADRPQLPIKISTHDSGFVMTNNKAATFKRHIFLSSMRKFGMGKKSMEARIHKEICHLLEECQHNLAFDPSLNVFNSVFNVICSVTLGQRFRYSDQRFKDLTDALFKIFHLYLGVAFIFPGAASLMELVVGRKSFQSNAAFYKILEPIIDQHHETYNEDNPRDLIDVLLKMTDDLNKGNSSQNLGKKGMPFKYFYIYAMILDIFAAGAETVSSTLTWGLLYVLKHPNVQDKIQVELDSIVGRDRLPNMSDKPNLPYTEAAITEVLRMASTVPLSVPRWTANDTSLFGYLIPKNTMILPNLWNVLHEPSLWRNPEQFYPDRFLDSNGKFTRSNQYIPFGLGSRVCLGEQLAKMELFLIFAGVLQHFRLEVDAHSSPLPSLDDGFMHITLRPPKFKMRMVKR